MASDDTAALVTRVRKHVKHVVGAWCDECGFEWPCEKAQLLAAYDAAVERGAADFERAAYQARQRGMVEALLQEAEQRAQTAEVERDALRADLARVTKELHRFQCGEQIESDSICDAVLKVQAELDRVTAERDGAAQGEHEAMALVLNHEGHIEKLTAQRDYDASCYAEFWRADQQRIATLTAQRDAAVAGVEAALIALDGGEATLVAVWGTPQVADAYAEAWGAASVARDTLRAALAAATPEKETP